jgi:raffinose/stachyose/melibiose transport system permease protein
MGSYVVARVWKNQIIYFFFILGIFIPIQAIVIPIFRIINSLKLLDSLWALIIIYIASSISFSFFVLEGFMKGIPFELEESAYIDGCGRTRSFISIILPMCKPGIMTILTFNFVFIWNDYLFASILIFDSRMKTLTVGIKSMADQFITDYSAICAGIIISFIPVFIMFLIFQEQIIKGMSMGALKG